MRLAVQGEVSGKIQQILIENDTIVKIGSLTKGELDGCEFLDTGGRILPGFIDVHVHGGGGVDVMEGTVDAYRQICQLHARHGTTALLLTTITAGDEDIEKSLRAYRPDIDTSGAEILGFHLEGPFISPLKPGAQPQQHIKPPSVERLRRWLEISQGTIKYMTMAPEVPGALELIDEARRLGIVVSAGHTNATYQEGCAAYARGVRSTTHLFNAMTGLNHREPGMVGAALDTPDVYAELIADTYHVHPAAMRIAIKEKGVDKLLLITDAVRAAGMPDGDYVFGERHITYRNGTVRLADGTLSGSGLTLDKAVRNLLDCKALKESQVPTVTSGNQSILFKLPHGHLAVGHPASLVAVDRNWQVTHTFVRGKLVYRV